MQADDPFCQLPNPEFHAQRGARKADFVQADDAVAIVAAADGEGDVLLDECIVDECFNQQRVVMV